MTLTDLAPVIAATWPPVSTRQIGPFTLPEGAGGGSRVSAARLTDPSNRGATEADLDAVLSAMPRPLFMVLDHQEALDTALEKRGLTLRDTTFGLITPCAALAETPPPVTCFTTWPPLAIQAEIWDEAGIGASRRAIMARAGQPKTTLFGRINDKPAGAAYVGMHGDTAMLHALEILPQHRRHGLAAIMMRAAGDWALGQGAARFSVLVTRENQPARRLYASLGFEPVGQYHYRTATA